MNRIPNIRQKNDVFGTYLLVTSDLELQLTLGFNDTAAVSQSCSSETSDTIQDNYVFTYSLNYRTYIWSRSRNASAIFLLNTSTNFDSINKTLSEDEIGNSNPDCSYQFDNELFKHLIGSTNL